MQQQLLTVVECSDVQIWKYEVQVKTAELNVLGSDGKPSCQQEQPWPPYVRTNLHKEL
jgi:hypothetical protein